MSKKTKEIKEVNGFTIPNFGPTTNGIIIPKLSHVILTEEDLEDDLLETEIELTARDFITTVLCAGPTVSDSRIIPGARIQIMPHEGQWYTQIDIDGEDYFLIKENVVIGIIE